MNQPEPAPNQLPITHGGVDYGGKLCQCSECGLKAICTPRFDFYVRSDGPENGPLVCERCLIMNRFKVERN